MTPVPIRGSAKILDFRARPRAGSAVLKGRPAEITHLRAPQPVYAVADIDAWYHTEAMMDAQSGGKR